MMKKNLLLIIIVSCTLSSVAQITFQKVYYSDYGQAGFFVNQTSDHGFILCGEGADTTGSGADVSLVKTDSAGNLEWAKSFGTYPNDDKGLGCVQTSDGGFVVTGILYWHMFLLKTDAAGNLKWAKTYDDTLGGTGFSVVATEDGGVVACGAISHSAFVVRTDSDGDVVWEKKYSLTGWDEPRCINHTSDGGYIMAWDLFAGYSCSGSCLVKIDGQGNVQWSWTYGNPTTSQTSYSVQQTPDKGYVASGITYENTYYGLSDACLIRTDSNGNLLWEKGYTVSKNLYTLSVGVANDDGFVLSGAVNGTYPNLYDAFLLKVDTTGEVVWAKSYGTPEFEYGESAVATTDGGYAITGYTSDSSYFNGAFLFKTDASGNSGCNESSLNIVAIDSPVIACLASTVATVISIPVANAVVSDYGSDTAATLCFSQIAECNADFVLIPDSFQTGLYWGYNLSTGNDLQYSWTWGDGTTGAGQYPIHYYADSGFYSICLMILDTVSFCSDTFCADYSIMKMEGIRGIHEINFVDYPLNSPSPPTNSIECNVYPNPVSSSATIEFNLNQSLPVSVKLFSLEESEVITIVDGNLSEGSHQFSFSRETLVDGIYFLQLKTSSVTLTKKLIIE